MKINKVLHYALGLVAALMIVQAPLLGSAQLAASNCVPVGTWVVPGGESEDARALVTRAARQSVVLLGERHDSFEHHRWQLQMLAALHAQRPDMIIGFESFPRRVQPALDRWVAGELSEAEFLKAADWTTVWNMDPALYMPLFHFARMNRIPMAALNIDAALRRSTSANGFAAVPEADREGVSQPAAASEGYIDYLLPIYREHPSDGRKPADVGREDPGFKRFVETQTLWDRAMAQGLRDAAERPSRPLVVGIMGGGHIVHGYGVPHQLRDLGLTDVMSLMPWDRAKACGELVAGYADAVFGVAAPAVVVPKRQLLGVQIETAKEGVRIVKVTKASIAEAAGLLAGDIIVELAGRRAKANADVIAVVRRQAPGTWLPVTVQRGDVTVDVIAKFPARPE